MQDWHNTTDEGDTKPTTLCETDNHLSNWKICHRLAIISNSEQMDCDFLIYLFSFGDKPNSES